jgi:hypothetical protein
VIEQMQNDRVTRWVHPLTNAEVHRLSLAFAIDRTDREVRGPGREVIGLRPMQWRHLNVAAQDIAAAYGFAPDGPGEFQVTFCVDWAEPGRLEWTAR